MGKVKKKKREGEGGCHLNWQNTDMLYYLLKYITYLITSDFKLMNESISIHYLPAPFKSSLI